MLRKIAVTGVTDIVTDKTPLSVTVESAKLLDNPTTVTDMTDVFIKDLVVDNVERNTTPERELKGSLYNAVTPVTPVTPKGLIDFVNLCGKNQINCDVFSYRIKSFSDHEVDEALQWCIDNERIREKWYRLGIEKQNKVLFHALVGRSLGFR